MNHELPNRKNIRLQNYDYSTSAAYFVTICTQDRKPILSSITLRDNEPHVHLTETGRVVEKYLTNMPGLEAYVIMPNHIHFIIMIDEQDDAADKRSLPQLIRSFKTIVSKEAACSLWQRNYYEHVIRSEKDMEGRMKYIERNPYRWADDPYFMG